MAPQRYRGHEFDLLRSRDVIGHVIVVVQVRKGAQLKFQRVPKVSWWGKKRRRGI